MFAPQEAVGHHELAVASNQGFPGVSVILEAERRGPDVMLTQFPEPGAAKGRVAHAAIVTPHCVTACSRRCTTIWSRAQGVIPFQVRNGRWIDVFQRDAQFANLLVWRVLNGVIGEWGGLGV